MHVKQSLKSVPTVKSREALSDLSVKCRAVKDALDTLSFISVQDLRAVLSSELCSIQASHCYVIALHSAIRTLFPTPFFYSDVQRPSSDISIFRLNVFPCKAFGLPNSEFVFYVFFNIKMLF